MAMLTYIVSQVQGEHMTPNMNSLHWLPVLYWSQYKFLVYAYKALHATAGQYLKEIVVAYHLKRFLRSGSEALLTITQTCGVMYGNRCSGAAANLWNNLSVNIRKFKTLVAFKQMMTNLFISAFLF